MGYGALVYHVPDPEVLMVTRIFCGGVPMVRFHVLHGPSPPSHSRDGSTTKGAGVLAAFAYWRKKTNKGRRPNTVGESFKGAMFKSLDSSKSEGM